MKITIASIASLLVFVGLSGVEAAIARVLIGDKCDNTSIFCLETDNLTCTTVPGRIGQYCVKLVGEGADCDAELNQCYPGYTCAKSGNYNPVCKPNGRL